MDYRSRTTFLSEDPMEVLEFIEQESPRTPQKYLKDVTNPFEKYSEVEFKSRYRFSKDSAIDVFGVIKHDESLLVRGQCLPPFLQFLVALRFFAKGHIQQSDGDLIGVSRNTARRSIHRIAYAIATQKPSFIQYCYADARKLNEGFFRIDGFPGVVGAIDCTHIPVVSPGGDEAEIFRNRKGFMSMNVQVICASNRKILNIVARWPGSTHDSRIFNNSSIKDDLESGLLDGVLLGDNGYACLPYLMTPLMNPTTRQEKRYNKMHIAIRSRVEHCFGVLKRRFLALSIPLRTRLDNSLTIIIAIACLHNAAINRNQSREDNYDIENQVIRLNAGDTVSGRAVREGFIAQM